MIVSTSPLLIRVGRGIGKLKHECTIRAVKLEDQKISPSLLVGFKLPLDGLEAAKTVGYPVKRRRSFGCAGLEIYGTQGLLRSVAVAEGKQRLGYGTLLVDYVRGQAKRCGVADCYC